MLKKIFPVISVFAIVFFSVIVTKAGIPSKPGGGGTPPCWPPPCSIPIDGGISFLIVAGATLAGKKLFDSSKEKK